MCPAMGGCAWSFGGVKLMAFTGPVARSGTNRVHVACVVTTATGFSRPPADVPGRPQSPRFETAAGSRDVTRSTRTVVVAMVA